MAAAEPAGRVERLRVSTRSVLLFVGLLGLTLLAMRMASAAERVIGWMLVAAAAAGLMDGVVRALVARGWPRGRAVLVLVAGTLLVVGLTTWRVVDDVQQGSRRLQRAAPEAAERIEQSERFGEVASTLRLRERTEEFMAELPARLRGGSTADALRAAATRGVAFLTTGVLTLFLLSHGQRLAEAGLAQIRDERRRRRVRRVGLVAYRRSFGYARGSLLMSFLAAWVAYGAAYAADVPGAAPLALWVALWDFVPIIGAVVGAMPIIVLAAVENPMHGVVLAVVFLAYQLFEDLVLQPRVEARSMRLGPFLTVAAGFAGLEIRGIPGALIAVLAVAAIVAALDEIATPIEDLPEPEPLPEDALAQ